MSASPIIKPGLIIGPQPVDPAAAAREILGQVGDLTGLQVFGNRVLVAIYVPGKTGSIVHTEGKNREDVYQGKIGLVLKMGHLAFKTDLKAGFDFGPDTIAVGDWVWFKYSDGHDSAIQPAGTFKKVPVKILRDTDIDGILPRPDFVY